jgi:hypothetical protein
VEVRLLGQYPWRPPNGFPDRSHPEVDDMESVVLAASVLLCVYASCYASSSQVNPMTSRSPRTEREPELRNRWVRRFHGSERSSQDAFSSQILLDVAFLVTVVRLVFGAPQRVITNPAPRKPGFRFVLRACVIVRIKDRLYISRLTFES